jgi:hypothetical protein
MSLRFVHCSLSSETLTPFNILTGEGFSLGIFYCLGDSTVFFELDYAWGDFLSSLVDLVADYSIILSGDLSTTFYGVILVYFAAEF